MTKSAQNLQNDFIKKQNCDYIIVMDLYNFLLFSVILIFSVLASVQDVKEGRVWNFLILAACLLGVCIHLIFNSAGFHLFFVSGLVFAVFYFVIRIITQKKLGLADVYFGFFQGICLPVKSLPFCVLAEVLFCLFFVIPLLKKKIPFIPFMAASLIILFLLKNRMS